MKEIIMWVILAVAFAIGMIVVTGAIFFGFGWLYIATNTPKCITYEYMQPYGTSTSGVKIFLKEGEEPPEGAKKVCAEWSD